MIDKTSKLDEIALNIVKRTIELGAEQSEAVVYSEEFSTTRFNNVIHQNISTQNFGLYITVVVDKNRLGSTSISSNELSDVEDSLKKVIKMARIAQDDPNLKSLPEQQRVEPLSNLYYRGTVELSPFEKAENVSVIVDSGLDHDKRITSVAGYFVNGSRTVALANSLNIDLVSKFSIADLQIGVLSKEAGTFGYGYSAKSSRDVSEFDFEGLTIEAAKNSVMSLKPRTIQPGEYEAVLKPYAVGVLFDRLGKGFSVESYKEGSSFLSDNLGERIFDEKLTLIDNGRDLSTLTAMPFDGEGVPKKELKLIDHGVVESLCYDSYYAKMEGKQSTGHRPHKIDRMDGQIFKSPIPMNQIVVPGNSSNDNLIEAVKEGLLITRLHYVTVMDNKKAILSGMTRDGTWFIEDGEIRYPVKNLRFTDSMLKAFNNIDAIGNKSTVEKRLREHTKLMSSLTVPSMKLQSFRITGLTEF